MPGPVSDTYDGPSDEKPIIPRCFFPHLSDEEYEQLIEMEHPMRCPKCGGHKTHYRLKGYRCPRCD